MVAPDFDVDTSIIEVAVEVLDQGVVVESEFVVVEVAEQGTRGPAGPPGPAGGSESPVFIALAGETMHGGRAARLANGVAYHPDTSEPSHAQGVAGITVHAAEEGSPIQIRAFGPMIDPAWSWVPGFVYCADAGVLTQSPASAGWLLPVARVRDSRTLDVAIGYPVMRS